MNTINSSSPAHMSHPTIAKQSVRGKEARKLRHSCLVLTNTSEQKKELSVLNCVLPTKGKHFYSSSESEEEEESHKKFNIKIKPLQSKDVLKNAATVDELKASIGNIALSPSPVVKKSQGPGVPPQLQNLQAPPPLPPKTVPATPPRTGSPLTVATGNDQADTEAKIEKLPSISDLDSIFGPVLSPKSVAVNTEEKWVHFSDASPEHVTPELTPREKVVTPPAASDIPADSPAPGPPGPPSSAGPPGPPSPRNVPSPLNLEEVQKKVAEQTFIKDDYLETLSSPKECGLGQRATPPPPPPPTYRTVVSSPGPGSGSGTGTTSGASSPARPATPLVPCSSTTPPPPPPRPPSRPKLPPGKPGVGDVCQKMMFFMTNCPRLKGAVTRLQVSAQGIQSTPLNLAVNWRCEPASTDLRIDYKYNTDAMTTAVALNNVQFLVPIDGGVTKLQAVLPPAVWNAEQQRILWKIPDISQKSENGGVGSLLARFQLSDGPSKPSPLVVQFTSEGSTLSGCDIELVGAGYRFSLIKKRFAAECDMMSALAKDKQFPALKKRGGVCSPSNHEFRQKEGHWRSKHSVSTVSYSDQPRQQYETSPFTVHMKNTYQLDEGREITQQLGTNESDEEIALPYRKSVAEIISF
ncbi:SH3-domain GRB2-like (endophilin) interacting protein 1 [Cricetulus griseus]